MMKSELQGVVPASYVGLLLDYLDQQRLEASAVLGAEYIDESSGQTTLARYPVARWKLMLERAATALNDPLLGLHLGQRVGPALFGALGYVLLACPDLGAALQRLEQYHRLIYDVNPLRSVEENGALVLSWGVERGRPGPLVDEFAIAALIRFARDITGVELTPQTVWFVNGVPADSGPFEAYFKAPVLFAQGETRVVFPLAVLDLPLRQPDAGLLALLEAQLEVQLGELDDSSELEQQVRSHIARLCRSGRDSLEGVAEQMCVSSRTLRRRLAEQGLSFRGLHDQTRRCLAEDYLVDLRLQLPEIALLLGFSAQSAFNRAFICWTGETPLHFRKRKTSAKR